MYRLPNAVLRRWRTLLILTVIGSSAFVAGAVANQVRVVSVQPIAGAHVLVPDPHLTINSVFWDINVTTQNLVALILNVSVPAGQTNTATFQIIVSVSCQNLTSGVVFWCAHGVGFVKLPLPTGNSAIVRILLNPQFDPELVEVHDLSFIVTALPPVPVRPCTSANCPPTTGP